MSETIFTCPIEWRLTRQEARTFEAIFDAPDIITRADLREKVSAFANSRVVDVVLFNTRKKLEPFNVEIQSVWGRGVRIDAHAKDLLRAGAVELPREERAA